MKRRESIKKIGLLGCLLVFPAAGLTKGMSPGGYFVKDELKNLGYKAQRILKETGGLPDIKDIMPMSYTNFDENKVHFYKARNGDLRKKKCTYGLGFMCLPREDKNHEKMFRKKMLALVHTFVMTIRLKPKAEIEICELKIIKHATGFYEVGLFGRGYL